LENTHERSGASGFDPYGHLAGRCRPLVSRVRGAVHGHQYFSGAVEDFQATLADGTLTGSAQIASLVTGADLLLIKA